MYINRKTERQMVEQALGFWILKQSFIYMTLTWNIKIKSDISFHFFIIVTKIF